MPEKYSFGLLGYPLGHSLSPKIHAAALNAHNLQGEYKLFPIKDEADLPGLIDLLRDGMLHGLNVTIPYKSTLINFLDDLTPTAKSIGAVNTISRQRNHLIGENTDAGGFLADLGRLDWFPDTDQRRHALLLGAGGSARAVAYALGERGWQLTVAARRLEQAEQLVRSLSGVKSGERAQLLAECIPFDREALSAVQHTPDLIINTTPLGMSPYDDVSPWPGDLAIPPQAAVYDLVYNPFDTQFTRIAGAVGLRAASGIGMLVEQAALSFEIWTGLPAPRAEMHASIAAHGTGVK
jgi:shikimate dehydrogenase